MDLTLSKLSKPDLLMNFVPIYWEPYPGTGERVVALVATKPAHNSSKTTTPKAYPVLPEKRLIAMLGKTRGISAHAIMSEAAISLTNRLEAGMELHEALPPFEGFSTGVVRRSSGWTLKQLLESAVRSVSAFGSTEELFPDEPEIAHHTATTREFLNKIQKSSFGVRMKERFNNKLKVSLIDSASPEITIDYCHNSLIVQATSLPSNTYQQLGLKQEGESKLLEMTNLRRHTQNDWQPKLLLNIEALDSSMSEESISLAKNALSSIAYFAKSENVEVIKINSADEAIETLEALDT